MVNLEQRFFQIGVFSLYPDQQHYNQHNEPLIVALTLHIASISV